MLDLTYALGTAAFFAAMLGYVRSCERLGRRPETTTSESPDGSRT